MGERPGREVLDSLVHREPIGDHDGRSGATLERCRLADGTSLVVKRFDPHHDLVMVMTHDDVGREYQLWSEGAFDGVPHPIVAGWRDDGVTVLAMRDLGSSVLSWDRRLSRADCRRIFAAMLGVHDIAGRRPQPDHTCPIEDRVAVLAPQRMLPFLDRDHALPGAVLTGWERFFELVDDDVAEAVRSVHERPGPLAAALLARPCTLIHADLFLVNIALDDSGVTFFDWGLATWAPSWLEATMFLAGAMSNVDATIEELVFDYAALSGERHDEIAMRLAMLCTLCDLAWNKALDAADHPDPDKRRHERRELDWWVSQARRTLDRGLVAL